MGRYRCNKGDIPRKKIWKPIGRITSMEHFARQKKLTNGAISIPLPANPLGRWHLLPQRRFNLPSSPRKRHRKIGPNIQQRIAVKSFKMLPGFYGNPMNGSPKLKPWIPVNPSANLVRWTSYQLQSVSNIWWHSAGLRSSPIDLGRSFAHTRLEPPRDLRSASARGTTPFK